MIRTRPSPVPSSPVRILVIASKTN